MMHRLAVALPLSAALAAITACTSNGGFLGTGFHPQGNITISDANAGGVLHTSLASPLIVNGDFTVTLSETDFNGPYSVAITSWNNNFDEPCFVPHMVRANTYTFSADHANPASDPPSQANPCSAGDVEQAQISDGDGHVVMLTYELAEAVQGGSAPSPAPTSASSPSPAPSSSPSVCSAPPPDPNPTTLAVSGAAQNVVFPCFADFTASVSLPVNSGAGVTLALASSSDMNLGAVTNPSDGTPLLFLGLEPSNNITYNAGSSIFATVASASQISAGHLYTVQVVEPGLTIVLETLTNLVPSGDTLTFNIAPAFSGTITPVEYVVIVYRSS